MEKNIDVSQLHPGDTVEQAECEKVIGFKRDEDKYAFQFELMQLSERIQMLLWREGRKYTVVCKDGSICILTHEQASNYNAKRFSNAIGKMRRCHKRLVAVDVSSFGSSALENHNLSLVKTSRILQSIKSTRVDIKPEAHVCTLPKRLTV